MRHRLLKVSLLSAALAICAIPAFADGDQVHFGSNIRVAPDASIQDAVCFFCNVDAQGTVEGDVVVFFGNVRVSGHANHDVINFFGDTTVSDDATVGQDMVNMFGAIRLGENVSVGQDMVAMFGSVHSASTVKVRGDTVIEPMWIFWTPLIIFILAAVLVIREFRSYRRRQYLRNYPFPPPPRP
jgi:hypothetical protein